MEIHRSHIQNHKTAQEAQKEKAKQLARGIRDEFENIPKPFKDAARGIEQQFVEFMVQQMHKTTGAPEDSNTATNYYNDLLYKEESNRMTEHKNGLGIQKLILDQIYPKKFRNADALAAFNAQTKSKNHRRSQIEMEGPQRSAQERNEDIKMGKDSHIKPVREDNHE